MQNINQIVKRTQIDSDNKRLKHSENSKTWSIETEKMVLGLFARLGDLFGELARAKGLEIKDGQGQYTRIFQLWCKKLSDVQPEQIANGVTNLERRIEETVRDGEKVWPPTYAEFRGLCRLSTTEKRIHRTWKGLPEPKMSQDERKAAMKKLRGDLKI